VGDRSEKGFPALSQRALIDSIGVEMVVMIGVLNLGPVGAIGGVISYPTEIGSGIGQ
jgi:hypothetical protein